MKYFICLLLFMWSSVSYAGEIIATVNDEPISSFDVDMRARLMNLQKGITSPMNKQMKKQILNALIDEKIKVQYAQKNGIVVRDEDVQNAIAHLEQQNGMKKGQLVRVLKQNNVPLDFLKDQIRSDLMWLQLVQRQKQNIQPVQPAEISARKNKIRRSLREEGYLLAEILIPNETEALKCEEEIRSGKIAFDQAARQYSKAPSASRGGQIGWVKKNHYESVVQPILEQMVPGQLSRPIETKNGFLILAMLDKKKALTGDTIQIWELVQQALTPDKTVALMPTIIGDLHSCRDFMTFARKEAIPESIQKGMVSPDQLPPELKDLLSPADANTVIGPLQMNGANVFFMKCSVSQKNVLPSDDEIRTQIELERLEHLSDKILENAKRFVVVEYK